MVVLRGRLWTICREECIVDFSDKRARFAREVHFFLDARALAIDDDFEAGVVFLEIRELNARRRVVRTLHVVEVELAEVADDNPARPLGVWQSGRVAFRLLERLQERTVRLLDGLVELLFVAFLLNHRVRRGNHDVDEARVREPDTLFEFHEVRRMLHTEHFLQELHPENLALLLLLPAPGPLPRKRLCRLLLLVHTNAPSLPKFHTEKKNPAFSRR